MAASTGIEQLKALFSEKNLQPALQAYFLETCGMASVEDFINNFNTKEYATEIKDVLVRKFPIQGDGPEVDRRTEEQQSMLATSQ